jgi:phage terminase small subunit
MALTDKQAAFCREYLIDLNGTQAAIRAGYSEKTAKDIAAENLQNPTFKIEFSN